MRLDGETRGQLKGWFGHHLRDLILGANDGIVTTFGIVAAVTGGGFPGAVILVLGFAKLAADGMSMGASSYLASRSENGVALQNGEQHPPPTHAMRHGGATLLAFLVAGSLPLAAYLTPLSQGAPFLTASLISAASLFAIGALRSLVVKRTWWESGAEMLALGGLAAATAYALSHLLAGFAAAR